MTDRAAGDRAADAPTPRATPGIGGTARALSLGTLLSAACFVVGFVLSLVGRPSVAGDPLRVDLLVDSIVELQPWGWSMLGVLVLLATPPLGLAVSYLEMRRLQPRAAVLALVVLGVLAVATLIALAVS